MAKEYITISKKAQAQHDTFKQLTGASNIAEPQSIEVVSQLIQRTSPRRVLEFGGGIGTLSDFCLRHSDAMVDVYEDNDFCQNAFHKNLEKFKDRYRMFTDYTSVHGLADSYDIVIGDGGPYELVVPLVNKSNISFVYFDGRRWGLQTLFHKALSKKYAISFLEFVYDDGQKKCGFGIACVPEKSAMKRWLAYRKARVQFMWAKIRAKGAWVLFRAWMKRTARKMLGRA